MPEGSKKNFPADFWRLYRGGGGGGGGVGRPWVGMSNAMATRSEHAQPPMGEGPPDIVNSQINRELGSLALAHPLLSFFMIYNCTATSTTNSKQSAIMRTPGSNEEAVAISFTHTEPIAHDHFIVRSLLVEICSSSTGSNFFSRLRYVGGGWCFQKNENLKKHEKWSKNGSLSV